MASTKMPQAYPPTGRGIRRLRSLCSSLHTAPSSRDDAGAPAAQAGTRADQSGTRVLEHMVGSHQRLRDQAVQGAANREARAQSVDVCCIGAGAYLSQSR